MEILLLIAYLYGRFIGSFVYSYEYDSENGWKEK